MQRSLLINVTKNLLMWILAILLTISVTALILNLFGFEFRAVLTRSMTPELPVGSLIITAPKKSADICVGDNITLLTTGDTVVTHKVVSIDLEKDEFITRGIANSPELTDAPNKHENIVGVVRLCIPGLGFVLNYLSSITVKIILITVAIGMFLTSLLIDILSKKTFQ